MDSRPVCIYVLGGPGSGKGTQCKNILDSSPGNYYHISTGQLLREATQQPTPEHAQIIQCMKQGKMVPSKHLVQLIKAKMNQVGNKVVYILDGFPRNDQNLNAWKEIMKDDVVVKFLLYFECTQDEMRKRLLGRAKTSGRADDNPQTIEKRIVVFNDETKKMLQTYIKTGGKLVRINANQSVQAISNQVRVSLKNHLLP